MEIVFFFLLVIISCTFTIFVVFAMKSANTMFYESKLGKRKKSLPPGDMGWPLIGNMLWFMHTFKSEHPDSFLSYFTSRYGRTGMYKAFMFGSPSVIVSSPETCKFVLTNDDEFVPGWPKSTVKLIGPNSFIAISYEEHKRLRRLTAVSVNGYDALSVYLEYIEDLVVDFLEEWSTMAKIEFLTELRRLTFRIIMHIFLSSESHALATSLEKEYTALNHGIRAMAIDLPGFAYHKALKARTRLVSVVLAAIRTRREEKESSERKRDVMDALLEAEDENGRKLNDDEVLDVLIMYLNAGHESSGHIMMWAAIFLQQNPEMMKKAKEEQEGILRRRPADQKGMTLHEFRQMKYLSNVVDETLRLITFSSFALREATKDVKMNGYIIPKGWKVLVWFRGVHMDPEVYDNPKEFDPSRWENYIPKPGTFLPFGAGNRLCPGNDLAKLEISVFLHYFVLNYRFERENPRCRVTYLPHPRPLDNCIGKLVPK